MSIFDIFKKLDEEKAAKTSQPIEWIVVGLGNPGTKYDNTRHNAGFRALEGYCARSGQKIDRMKFKALAGEGMLGGKRVLFLKPQTFMNLLSCCRTMYRLMLARCACAQKARQADRTV